MQVVVVAFAAVVLGVGILATNHEETPSSQSPVLAEETEQSTATPVPTVMPTQVSATSQYVYPNATALQNTESRIELTTSDGSNTVTDWYRNAIKQQGFSVTSAVKTATNGVVNNKLVGSDGEVTVTVDISQEGDSNTSVTVTKS